ncbi:MAG: 4Fe-4S dicluster domain-containing protein [Candidatus Methanolliviera hydrocarbonicum]|uniref:4Fe-4S dicluster domain-containing protein n=1 Tax=Candidatus Methanolliviera hydrocarbonicum TaxID=2491085 RepID=A0A520KU71_9EURY|nr:MAG: 4Fe-4S dicluster domain-containing protein [Candidatus Methanolliviera hydrocarbonicum]
MSEQFIFCDLNKCTNCRLCMYACSFVKSKKFSPIRSRIKVLDKEHKTFVAITCNHCENAPCVACCPMKALKRNEDGIIVIDEGACTGCGWCIIHCPLGAISIDPDKRVVTICDLCDGDPECVKICPTDALEMIEGRGRYASKMHEVGLKMGKELL